MRLMKLSVPLAILALAAVACDGDNTPGAGGGAIDTSAPVSQVVPNTATQPAGNTATQPAPNTATQPAPNTATQPAPNTATQAAPFQGCLSACSRIVAMGCSDTEDTDCATSCALLQSLTDCQSAVQAMLTCAAAASSCDDMKNNCEAAAEAFDDCVDGGTSELAPTPTTTCGPENNCTGCTTTCDACTCSLERTGGYSQSEITTMCASNCSSS